MVPIISFLQDRDFDAEAIKAIGEAFNSACKDVVADQPDIVKEVIAKRIIEAARKGERDPLRLCAKALDALGLVRRFS